MTTAGPRNPAQIAARRRAAAQELTAWTIAAIVMSVVVFVPAIVR